MKRVLLVLIPLVLLLALGLWWFSPQQAVKRRSSNLMEVLTLSEGAGMPMRQAKVFSLNAMMAPRVEIAAPEIPDADGSFDKQEIESAFSWICRHAKRSDFKITEWRRVEIDGDNALANFRAEGFLELPTYRPADGAYEVTIHWEKGSDGWRFRRIEWRND
jgi:hypothetical protein